MEFASTLLGDDDADGDDDDDGGGGGVAAVLPRVTFCYGGGEVRSIP